MEVEAGPLLPLVPWEFLPAGGQLQGPADGVQDRLGVVPPAEWPKVFCPVVGQFPLDGKAGVQLFHGKTDVGVALVIFQQDIIVGLMSLDEGVFQHQGLELRPGHDGVEVVDLGDHGAGLFVVV